MLNRWRASLCAPFSADHPLWLCGFRSFFLFTTLSATLLIGLWSAALTFGAGLPPVAGGALVWHAHELIFGFGLAAVAGFALTAVPEFTGAAAVAPRAVRRLAACWLLGRLAFALSGLAAPFGPLALGVSAFAHLGLLGGLIGVLAPRLWQDPERRHLSFLWGLIALTLLGAGFYVDALRGEPPARWLYAMLGVLMVLIVVAMSRISMSIVNAAIEELDLAGEERSEYRARPPRRNLAIVCIALYSAVEFFAPGARIGGWLALAAAAALCNLQSDWHVGRALFRRWPLMLFGVYVLMALGYATLGLALLGIGGTMSAGRHLLTVGALGLNVYVVLCIAGRIHCGQRLDERPWVPLGAVLLVAAAGLRAGADSPLGLAAAGLCWMLPFAAYAGYQWPLLTRPRTDGGSGCAGIAPASG